MATSKMASQFTGLPMKALIGAPLKAATDANAMMAKAQTQFLLSTCFEPSETKNGHLKPIMIRFEIERKVLDAKGNESETLYFDLAIPLMTIIPLNSLAVESLTVSFEMEVKSSREFSRETSQDIEQRKQDNGKMQATTKSHEFDTELHGTLASKSHGNSSERNGANYEVELKAGTLPLPGGVKTILDAFNKSFSPILNKQTE